MVTSKREAQEIVAAVCADDPEAGETLARLLDEIAATPDAGMESWARALHRAEWMDPDSALARDAWSARREDYVRRVSEYVAIVVDATR